MTWIWIIVIAGLALAALALGWNGFVRSFMRRYFEEHYQPVPLEDADTGAFPSSHHLRDVPWFSTRETYCEANTLQMIAHQQGKPVSREEVNFLMGFTYGASGMPAAGPFGPPRIGFSPFTDPEPGHAMAAPYLGLVRHYRVTRDLKLYLRALRYHLSQGHALHVPLDYAVLYDLEGFFPHSDLLVGYDQTGFYYFETVCLEGVPCTPGVRAPGETGLRVSDEKLLEAIESQSRRFTFPWRYAFSVFESGLTQTDLRPVWARNAALLSGGSKYGPKRGADAIEQTAAQITASWRKADLTQLRQFMESAIYSRHDNADFLRAHFAGDERVTRAANLFERAVQRYGSVLEAVQNGIPSQTEADRIAAWLREAAATEREGGALFKEISISPSEHPTSPQADWTRTEQGS
jgi:hypothetical protein